MAELVATDVVDPFEGRYEVTFPAYVSGEEAQVDVDAVVLVQTSYREIEATSLHDVAGELGQSEHALSWYAAELARKCAAVTRVAASATARATLDDGVVVTAMITR